MSSSTWREYGIDLGTVTIALQTGHADLVRYLREFYQITDGGPAEHPAAWTIRAEARAAERDMALTPWKVGYRADPGGRVLTIYSTNERDLAITTRKAIREVLLDYCEARHYTMLHASAVADDNRVILLVGDKGSGKTTLALNAALTWGYQYLSNDHLILYRSGDGLVITSLPTPIPIKIGTYLDYEDRLGEPWENEGVDIDAFRKMPRLARYGRDRRLLFTFARLGQPHPVHTALGQRDVTVALADYGPNGRVSVPAPVEDPAVALWPHVRFDWVFDPNLNTRYLPRRERNRDHYAHDSRGLLTDLAACSRIVQWCHRGKLGPLSDWLADSGVTA
ncbi:hypothetical protein [Nocardia altamirensis]|uniref:hypothetical protein n=1 Tax=Nocardia altamirensis TaxID=472158 RepID=UPI000840958A|nr:hypothetical protein [Nocardia altamirensis]